MANTNRVVALTTILANTGRTVQAGEYGTMAWYTQANAAKRQPAKWRIEWAQGGASVVTAGKFRFVHEGE